MITYNGLTRYDAQVVKLKIFAEIAYSGSFSDIFFPSSQFDFKTYSELEINNFLDTYNPPELDYLNNLTFDNELARLYYIRTEKFKKVPIGTLYSLNCFQLEKLRQVSEFLHRNFGSKLYLLQVDIGYFSLSELKIVFLSDITVDYHIINNYDYSSLTGKFTFNPFSLITYAGIYNLPYLKEIGMNSQFYIKYLSGAPKPNYTANQLLKMPQVFRESVENVNITDMNQLNSSLRTAGYFKILPLYTEAFFVIPTLVTYNQHYRYSEDWTASRKNGISITSPDYVNQIASFYTFGNPTVFYFGVVTQYDSYYLDDKLIGEIYSNFVFYSYFPYGFDADYASVLDGYKAPPEYDPTLCCLAQCFGITE